MTDRTISLMNLNYTSLIYWVEPRMRCALKALILILLCQTPFAVGLNIVPSRFQDIIPDYFSSSKIYQAFDTEKLLALLPSFPATASGSFSCLGNGLEGDFGAIYPGNIVPTPVSSPSAHIRVSGNLDIWPSPSVIPSPSATPSPDFELFDATDSRIFYSTTSSTKAIDIEDEDEPDQDIPIPSYFAPSSSAHASPDGGIIHDPDAPPEPFFDDPAKKMIMEIMPDRSNSKYVIEEQFISGEEWFTFIKKIPLIDETSAPDDSPKPLAQEFQMLLLKPHSQTFLIEDREQDNQFIVVSTVTNRVLSFILGLLKSDGAVYAVIYNDNGSLIVKVRYANGKVRILTQEDILFKFGEWFNEFFDSFLESLYGYATPYTPYSSQSRSVVIAHKKEKQHKKGDPVKPDSQPVDGQGNSKPASDSATPDQSNSLPLPSAPRRQLSAPNPGPSGDKPEVTLPQSKGDGATAYVASKQRIKPENRFVVAKATSELAADTKLQSRGVHKLTQALTRGKLKAKFKEMQGFPSSKSAKVQIKWLLAQGHAIPLSELVVEKASRQWLDTTAHTLIQRHLTRAKSHKRTRIKTADSTNQHSSLVEKLKRAFPAEEPVVVKKPKLTDHAALQPLLKNGWRLVFANGKKAPLYNSAQQRQLLTAANTPNIDEALTVSTQNALEFLLWDAQEALRVSRLITQIVSPTLDAEMKQVLESTPVQPGMIEKALGIARHIRLVDHPIAGGGRLVLGPSQRHIKVSYFNNPPFGEHVHVEVSIDFTDIIIANPMQEQTKVPMTIAMRTVYRLPLHPGASSVTATQIQDSKVVIVTDPHLPHEPSAVQIQEWTTALRDKQTQLFYESLKKTEERLREWDARDSIRPPVDLAKLKEDSRKLKLAQQGFAKNFDFVKSWSELPATEFERVTNKLDQAMTQYNQLLSSTLEDEAQFSGSTHERGWELVRDYRQYVRDMQTVFEKMEEIKNRRHQLTTEDIGEIEQLTKLTEKIGGRARHLQSDELPLRRKALRKSEELTSEQDERTEQLRTVYYPLTSAFNIAKAQVLFNPPQAIEETDHPRASLLIPDNDDPEANPVTFSPPEISPLDVTLPFTLSDGSQEDYEEEIPAVSGLEEPSPETSSEESDQDNSPEDDDFM